MSTPAPHPPSQPDPLAVTLAKLDPAPHGFDWNALMFAAGRESKARALLFWRVVAVACALLAAGLAVILVVQLGSPTAERIVYVDRVVPVPPRMDAPAPAAPASAPPWADEPAPEPGAAARWFDVRNELLTVGLSALPEPGPRPPAPTTAPAIEK